MRLADEALAHAPLVDRTAYLDFVGGDSAVNWSDELEELHEESTRDHFIDVWTRTAIRERVGPLAVDALIADIGCSTGYLLEDLRTAYPAATLFGVDLIAAGLPKAHAAIPDARLLRADACALPFADAALDAVVSANLLEHVPDDVGALREMHRSLRPGGVAVVVVPCGPDLYDYYDRFLGHERRYARGEMAGKAVEAGFVVDDDIHLGSILFPAFWGVKKRNRRRFGDLTGDALTAQVEHDVDRTQGSRLGAAACRFERRLIAAGVRLPFGIRGLTVLRRRPQST